MIRATNQNNTFRISSLITDPDVRAAFERAERDMPPALVVADRPQPVLTGGDAVRIVEMA